MSDSYEPPPPPNGGNTRDYLQRIESKADAPAVQAGRAMAAVERLNRALLGDLGNPGRIGNLERSFNEFVTATEAREDASRDNSHFRISNRLGSITVIVMALVGLGSIIVALVK